MTFHECRGSPQAGRGGSEKASGAWAPWGCCCRPRPSTTLSFTGKGVLSRPREPAQPRHRRQASSVIHSCPPAHLPQSWLGSCLVPHPPATCHDVILPQIPTWPWEAWPCWGPALTPGSLVGEPSHSRLAGARLRQALSCPFLCPDFQTLRVVFAVLGKGCFGVSFTCFAVYKPELFPTSLR